MAKASREGYELIKATFTLRRVLVVVLISLACVSCVIVQPHSTDTSLVVADEIERNIVSVQQWGGTPAIEAQARKHTITRITLHHQGESFLRGRDPQLYLRNLQAWSRNTRRWLDIPYHYIIDLDGIIYEGRNINYAGDTNTDYDPSGHALIEVVGNFEEVEPTQAQLDAVVKAMTMLAAKYKISPDSISGHKDFSTQTVCPGKNLYRYLESGYFQDRVRANLKRAYF